MDLTTEQKSELKQKLVSLAEVEYTEICELNEALKDSLGEIKEMYGVSPKIGRKLIKTFYDESIEEDKAEFEEFNKLYEEVLG